MNYTSKNYKEDLFSKEIQHTKSRERFEAFYTELGKGTIQKAQGYIPWRTDWIQPLPGKRILELGCHVGFNCIHYAKKGFYCTGVDISQTLIDEARKKSLSMGPDINGRITLIKSFIEDLELEPVYGTILLTETLEHVIDPLPVLIKAREFLLDDGIIFVTAPNKNTGNNSHVRGVPKLLLELLCEKADLKIVRYKNIPKITAAVLSK